MVSIYSTFARDDLEFFSTQVAGGAAAQFKG